MEWWSKGMVEWAYGDIRIQIVENKKTKNRIYILSFSILSFYHPVILSFNEFWLVLPDN